MARKKSQFVYARQTIAIAVGASPVEYKTARVFDRRKQEWVDDVPLHMAKPVKEENVGVHYVFKSGEKVPADHPAVLAKPSAFIVEEEESVSA